jgi:transglutaminase-like putative cysteine protease
MNSSIFQQVENVPVKKLGVGRGDNAVFNILKIMKNIINESSINYYVRRFAEKIIEDTDPRNPFVRINSVYQYLAANTIYAKDPHGMELIKTPPVSLALLESGERPVLDCDDYTVLSLSLLKSVGFPVMIKIISTKPDKKFNHVYGLVYTGRTWMPFDATRPDFGLGWEFPNPTRVAEMRV